MKDKRIRVATEFDDLVERIAREKIINGTAKDMKSRRRITLAMVRHSEMDIIARDVANADLEKE